jgi:hypothetical protein
MYLDATRVGTENLIAVKFFFLMTSTRGAFRDNAGVALVLGFFLVTPERGLGWVRVTGCWIMLIAFIAFAWAPREAPATR